jgi:hypothetical protein
MFETLATIFVYALEAYAGLGVMFAVLFVCFGVQRLDSEAQGSGKSFRFLILPGVAAFWPLFLRRWTRGMVEPPVEKTPHRLSNLG